MADLQINAPGVPPLIGGVNIALPTLLTADAISGYGALEQWGVYLGGAPVITFDTFVSIDYRRGWALSDYPVERGAFQTYDKVWLPFDVRVKMAVGRSIADRQAFLNAVEAVSGTLQLYSVVTPERTYPSVNVQHIDYHRTATNGLGLITVEMWLLEVRVGITSGMPAFVDASGNAIDTSSTLSGPSSPLTSTAPLAPLDVSGNTPVDDGSVTSQEPTDAQAQDYINSLGAGGF